MTFSKNGVSIATFIVLVLGYFGIDLEVQSVVDLIAAIALLVSTSLTIYNQLTRSDVKWFFLKK